MKYQNVKQDADYLEAAKKETELSQQFKELDLSDEQRKIIMQWTDAIHAQESAYTAVVFLLSRNRNGKAHKKNALVVRKKRRYSPCNRGYTA